MPLTAPRSASAAIAARRDLETISTQVREAPAGIVDVAQLADAVSLFNRIADAGREAAALAKRLSHTQSPNPGDASRWRPDGRSDRAHPPSTAETCAPAMSSCSVAAGAAEMHQRRREDALDALPELLAELRRVREDVAKPCGTGPLPEVPVSLARAARLLGRSKTRTLRPAVDAGIVRTLHQGKRQLVPPDELRRLAAEGIVPPRRPSRRRRAASRAAPRGLAEELARVAALRREE